MFLNSLFLTLGGFSIFYYGLNLLKNFFSVENNLLANKLIEKFTKTDFRAFFVGIIATILVQSSSCITAITLTFISCNLLSMKRGLLIIIGANIGTCFTSFLFTINISNFSYIIVFIALLISFFEKKNKTKLSTIIYAFGFIFTGLNFLELGLSYLSKLKMFNDLLFNLTKINFIGLIVSTLLTALVQSSSVIIALTQNLYYYNSIEITQSIIIVLGANIGTCFTGIISTISSNTISKKTAYANVIFNFIGALIFLILIVPFSSFVLKIQSIYFLDNTKLTISFIHTFFNIISGIFGYIFIDYIILFLFKNKSEYKMIIDNK